MPLFQKGWFWGLAYGLLLAGFTLYVVLDTFVISRVYTVLPQAQAGEAASGEESSLPAQEEEAAAPVVTGDSYEDENIRIQIIRYREYDTDLYVADVVLSSPEYLKTAFAQNAYGRNVTAPTSETAQAVGAILAVNGDYYGAQQAGYVIRGGVLYRESARQDQEDLVLYEDGSLGIIREGEVSARQLLEQGAREVFSFGPALVEDGEIAVTREEEVGRARQSNPRTALAEVEPLHYLFVVADGRTEESEGLTLYELAEFLQSLGAQTAYNLDGGGSSTFYFNGQVLNRPTTSGDTIRERSVSDIVYIGL